MADQFPRQMLTVLGSLVGRHTVDQRRHGFGRHQAAVDKLTHELVDGHPRERFLGSRPGRQRCEAFSGLEYREIPLFPLARLANQLPPIPMQAPPKTRRKSASQRSPAGPAVGHQNSRTTGHLPRRFAPTSRRRASPVRGRRRGSSCQPRLGLCAEEDTSKAAPAVRRRAVRGRFRSRCPLCWYTRFVRQ